MNIGVDIIEIKRFRRIKVGDYSSWDKVFAPKEWAYAFAAANAAERLAGIFAAKEAAMKATGKVGPKNFRQFEIIHGKDGEPKIAGGKLYISVSHTKDLAVAVACPAVAATAKK